MTRRDPYWDNIKGLLIFLVVFGHCLWEVDGRFVGVHAVLSLIYAFHMPAFAFLSGRFGSRPNAGSRGSILWLFMAFCVVNLTMSLFWGIEPVLEPKAHAWYLLALCAWRALTKHVHDRKGVLAVAITATFAIGFFPSVGNTLALTRILAFWPFYAAGYSLSGEPSVAIKDMPPDRRLRVSATTLPCAVALFAAAYGCARPDSNALLFWGYGRLSDLIWRVAAYAIAICMILFLLAATPRRNMGALTMIGRNSLGIYALHRPITYLFPEVCGGSFEACVLRGVLFSAVVCVACGNAFVAGCVRRLFDSAAAVILGDAQVKIRGKLVRDVVAVAIATGFCLNAILPYVSIPVSGEGHLTDPLPERRLLSDGQAEAFEDAVRITFAGDLILLEDQVRLGWDGSRFDFSDVFEYAKPYVESADLAIGVFEGPTAGEHAGYSSGNFDDGKAISLNFPDEFAKAVQDAGFDLVTTANNHILDKGIDGAMRTLDVLDGIGLDYVGSYRSPDDRESVKIVETGGIRIAVLAYTYGVNGMALADVMHGPDGYVTKFATGTDGPLFDELLRQVESDFQRAKAADPDLIMVLPHLGTQFETEPDIYQETWFGIFRSLGADIILGDHAHTVQPVRLTEQDGRTVFEAYCPGNFVNSYGEHGGHATALVDVYVDRTSKTVIGGAVVPCYVQAQAGGNYRSLPIHSIMTDAGLYQSLGRTDVEAAMAAYSSIMWDMLGVQADASACGERAFLDEDGYLRKLSAPVDITADREGNPFWQAVHGADTICFVGDSITEGSKNGGYSWYEPMERALDRTILSFARGGATSKYLLDHADEIPQADAYVIAVGANDVRYRDATFCAMDPDGFAANLSGLRDILSCASPGAAFVFIAPWPSGDGDANAMLPFDEKRSLTEAYSSALQAMCDGTGDAFIDPGGSITTALSLEVWSDYMLDAIHPNAGRGVRVYCEAVLDFPGFSDVFLQEKT